MACPDDDRLVRFAEHRLDQAAASAVERHIDSCGACRELLSAIVRTHGPPPEVVPPPVTPDARRLCPRCFAMYLEEVACCAIDGTRLESFTDDPLVGRTIDRYVIEAPLGAGAMGSVYRVRHAELGRHYAMKLLFGELASNRKVVQRFRREAQAMAAMRHPNIVAVEDFGSTEAGLAFLVMELVGGLTLRDALRQVGRFSPHRARSILHQIALGLSEAHRRGFVHRDLKPANIMLAQVEDTEQVKILDFGLVAVVEAEGDESKLTSTGFTLGTPAYIAPEQVTQSRVGPAADQYAVGVIGFEMITGSPPFQGSTRQLLLKQLSEPAPPLPAAGGLEHVVGRLLAKHPERRFESADQLAASLERLDGAAFEDPNPGPMPEAAALSTVALLSSRELARLGRHRGKVAAAIGVAVLVGLALGLLLTGPGARPTVVSLTPAPPIAPIAPVDIEPPAVTPEGAPAPVEVPPVEVPPVEVPPVEVPPVEVPPVEGAPADLTPAEAVVDGAAKSAAAPAERRRTARRTPPRRPRAAPLPSLSGELAEMEAAVDRAVARRGLVRADLADLPQTAKALAQWRVARKEGTRTSAATALAELLAAIDTAPISEALLQRKLSSLSRSLESAGKTIPASAFRRFEDEFLDISMAVGSSPAPARRTKLARRIAALMQALERARPR